MLLPVFICLFSQIAQLTQEQKKSETPPAQADLAGSVPPLSLSLVYVAVAKGQDEHTFSVLLAVIQQQNTLAVPCIKHILTENKGGALGKKSLHCSLCLRLTPA